MLHKIRDIVQSVLKQEEDFSEINEEFNISNNERLLLANVFNMRTISAQDIMVPRADVIAAPITSTFSELVDIFSQCSYSQIPVYKTTLDDVVGIITIKRILPFSSFKKEFDIQKVIKDVLFVAPNMQLTELLVEMWTAGNSVAMVVDEFGGVDGLITVEDIVREIAGEIQHMRESPEFIKKQDGSYYADAKVLITDCEENLGIKLLVPLEEGDEIPDVETLGGLVTSLAGRVPTKGEVLSHPSGVEFEISDADPRRVRKVMIRTKQKVSAHY